MPDLNEPMRADPRNTESENLDAIERLTGKYVEKIEAAEAARRQHGSAAQAVAHAWFHRGMVNFDSEEALAALDDGKGTPIPLFAAPPVADAAASMVDCGDCEGSGRISPVELCQRCNESGILPAPAEVAAEQPKLRHSEAYVADLEDSLKQVASLLDVKGGADDLIAAVKRLVAAEQPAAEPEQCDSTHLLPLPAPDHSLDCGMQPFYRPDQMHAYARAHLNAAGQGSKDSERLDFTEAQISAAGRALADRSAAACNVDRDDNWKINSEFFIADARAAIDAAMKAGAQGGGNV